MHSNGTPDYWNNFRLNDSIEKLVEKKVNKRTLDFKTFMKLIEKDYRSCEQSQHMFIPTRLKIDQHIKFMAT